MITQLGSLGFETTRPDEWLDLATRMLGFEARASDGGDLLLRMDERHHRIEVTPSDRDRLAFIGWDVADEEALGRVRAALHTAGVAHRDGESATRKAREVAGLVQFEDPDGFPLEVSYGATIDVEPFRPGRPISGFRTGDQGLGHVVLVVADVAASVYFYRRVLGFRISNYIHFKDGTEMTFLHCNSRHHSLALLPPAFGFEAGQLQHFLIEVNSIDDVGRALDLCSDAGTPIVLSLGRHSNDNMLSFYLQTPSNFFLEYGTGGRTIEDGWSVTTYEAAELWGHHFAK